MKHFLEISQLSLDTVRQLLTRAEQLRQTTLYPKFSGCSLVNLFYEPSTRTRVSFELAAIKLAIAVVNLDSARSSETKGEQLEDTVKTLGAMGVNLLVVRHSEDGLPARVAAAAPDGLHVINAGDGQHAHPTQALLDWMTILQHKPHTARLKIAMVGDLRHSRVANSLQALACLWQTHDVVLVAPPKWLPMQPLYGQTTSSLREGLQGADVVVALRVQRERLTEHEVFDVAAYRADYAVTAASMALAKPDAIVLHPGPVNRGIELDHDVADGPQAVIWQQVSNGVMMRMAIIEHLLTQTGAGA